MNLEKRKKEKLTDGRYRQRQLVPLQDIWAGTSTPGGRPFERSVSTVIRTSLINSLLNPFHNKYSLLNASTIDIVRRKNYFIAYIVCTTFVAHSADPSIGPVICSTHSILIERFSHRQLVFVAVHKLPQRRRQGESKIPNTQGPTGCLSLWSCFGERIQGATGSGPRGIVQIYFPCPSVLHTACSDAKVSLGWSFICN
jgi:hypothetical protein